MIAWEGRHRVLTIEPDYGLETQPEDERAALIRKFLGILDGGNLALKVSQLRYVSGQCLQNGETATELAARLGVSKQAFLKGAMAMGRELTLPEEIYMVRTRTGRKRMAANGYHVRHKS